MPYYTMKVKGHKRLYERYSINRKEAKLNLKRELDERFHGSIPISNVTIQDWHFCPERER